MEGGGAKHKHEYLPTPWAHNGIKIAPFPLSKSCQKRRALALFQRGPDDGELGLELCVNVRVVLDWVSEMQDDRLAAAGGHDDRM